MQWNVNDYEDVDFVLGWETEVDCHTASNSRTLDGNELRVLLPFLLMPLDRAQKLGWCVWSLWLESSMLLWLLRVLELDFAVVFTHFVGWFLLDSIIWLIRLVASVKKNESFFLIGYPYLFLVRRLTWWLWRFIFSFAWWWHLMRLRSWCQLGVSMIMMEYRITTHLRWSIPVKSCVIFSRAVCQSAVVHLGRYCSI